MGRVKRKDPTLSTRQSGSTPYGIVHKLRSCAPTFLTHPDALDLLIETAPAIEAYRGKGTQPFNDGRNAGAIRNKIKALKEDPMTGFSLDLPMCLQAQEMKHTGFPAEGRYYFGSSLSKKYRLAARLS